MKGAGCNLLGRDWLAPLHIQVHGINQVEHPAGVDPLATQSAGEDEIVADIVWVAASLKAHGYEVIVDADGSLSSLLGSSSETCLAGEPLESTPASSEPCHAGGSRTSSGTTCTDNGE
ncbi:hypothetical protein MTO96_033819 [Rhipicephalus appendiculatus]